MVTAIFLKRSVVFFGELRRSRFFAMADGRSSAASTARMNVRMDYRVLSGLMMERPMKVFDSIENRLMEDNCKRVLGIVRTLLDQPDKIQKAEVWLANEGLAKTKKVSVDNDAPMFDAEVVSGAWLGVPLICIQHVSPSYGTW